MSVKVLAMVAAHEQLTPDISVKGMLERRSFEGFAAIDDHAVDRSWRVARREGWDVHLHGTGSGLAVGVVVDSGAEDRHAYMRQTAEVRGDELMGLVGANAAWKVTTDPIELSLSLYLLSPSGRVLAEATSQPSQNGRLDVLLDTAKLHLSARQRFELVFQVNLLGGGTARFHALSIALLTGDLASWRPNVVFYSFGDETKASSRLRVFKLAEELRARGCVVDVNPSSPPAHHVDLAVFQKVRPFARARALANRGAQIVYDMDDNYLLDEQGTRGDVVAFLNVADCVTVGSEKILADIAAYHSNVALLENPVDVNEAHGPVRSPRGRCERIGWFGAPENRYQLEELKIPDVVTITRGGDLEWALETIDDRVAELDLALMPVSASSWNLSKNANRMIKALALGVPVLASDTPEHRTVIERIGLPTEMLVDGSTPAAWRQAIETLRRRFPRVERMVHEAHGRVRKEYSAAKATAGWLDQLRRPEVPASLQREAPAVVPADTGWSAEAGASLHVTMLAAGLDAPGAGEWIRETRGALECSPSLRMFALGDLDLRTTESMALGVVHRVRDPLRLYQELDRHVDQLADSAHLLLLPQGFSLTHACNAQLQDLFESTEPPDAVFLGSNPNRGTLEPLPTTPPEAADFFWKFHDPGPCVIRAGFLRELGLRFGSLRSHWTWAALVVALFADHRRVVVSDFPCSVRSRPLDIVELPALHRATSPELDKEAHRPSPHNQWLRMAEDVLVDVMQLIPERYHPLVVSRGARALTSERARVARLSRER